MQPKDSRFTRNEAKKHFAEGKFSQSQIDTDFEDSFSWFLYNGYIVDAEERAYTLSLLGLESGGPSEFAEIEENKLKETVLTKSWSSLALSADNVEKLRWHLRQALDELDSLAIDQQTKSQARGWVRAALALVDQPEPDFESIRRHLWRADRLVSYSGWFFGLAGFIGLFL
ncbi:hypothetical protein N8940_01295 [Sphingomonadaceae bacterium]|nr:hypothetical protein [Sphingomonadaceae bacterium]